LLQKWLAFPIVIGAVPIGNLSTGQFFSGKSSFHHFEQSKLDGVAKTHQLLRCCNCSRHCGVPKYASFLDNCAPCIWRFLLSHSLFGFLAKASSLSLASTGKPIWR
jgi:hypothetical protein